LSAALPVILALQEAVIGKASFSALDVGPGHGKYGLLMREYLHGLDRLDAVEAESRYITPVLWEVYDRVMLADVRELDAFDYDVVLMADVIEHLEKQDGRELLERITCPVVITTPSVWFQNPEADQGWPTERHRSIWGPQDFNRMTKVQMLAEDVMLVAVPGR
jgi:2-polyprenyl-3-methyl-5-hydroxy-6-metoxy-1,4-benzoquinol methylase